MKPPEEIAAEIEWSHQGIAAAVRAARAEAWRAGAEAMRATAAKICNDEASEYKQHSMKCDAGGNMFGGTMDTCALLACERVRDAIQSQPIPEPPQETPK